MTRRHSFHIVECLACARQITATHTYNQSTAQRNNRDTNIDRYNRPMALINGMSASDSCCATDNTQHTSMIVVEIKLYYNQYYIDCGARFATIRWPTTTSRLLPVLTPSKISPDLTKIIEIV